MGKAAERAEDKAPDSVLVLLIFRLTAEMQSCAKSWGLFLAKSANPSAPCRHLPGKSRLALKVQGRFRTRGASACSPSPSSSAEAALRGLRTSAAISSRQIERILPRHDDFTERHIGPGEREKREMLDVLGLEVRDAHSPKIKLCVKIRVNTKASTQLGC